MAAAGGAVGLGNIWRYPYMLGQNGGGAFLLVNLFFVLMIGIPLMMTEFVIGRRTQSNVVGAYKKLERKKGWAAIGYFGILAAVLILLIRFPWNKGSLIGFGLVLGGALGNLYDRLRFSAVRDIIRLDFMHFYIFNLADAGVVVGAVLIVLFTLFARKEQ